MPTSSSLNTADIRAVILAGGKGTRLRSVVADRPKVLAQVCGKPFLEHLLDQLHAAGFRHVTISTGYMAEMVEETIGTSYRDMDIAYSREETPLGTGGGVRLAMQRFPAPLTLVMNGDSVCNADLRDYVAWFQRHDAPASLLLTRVENTGRYGRVETDGESAVTSFVEKGDSQGPGYINAGLYLLRPEAFPADVETSFSIEQDVFPRLVKNGLIGYSTEAEFIDIGTPESYARAEAFFSTLQY